MATKGITHLIVNSPCDEPKHHWLYHRETQNFTLEGGRPPAGYVIASESSKAFDDPGRFIPIELVSQIASAREGVARGRLPPPPPKIRIEALREKAGFLISWPNVIRIDRVYRPKLELDLKKSGP